MNRKSFALFLTVSIALTSLALSAGARTGASLVAKAAATQTSAASVLAMLPPSDFVAVVNVRRLINEAAPKVFADNPTKLAEFNAEIDRLKARTGLDARSFSTIAVGMRYLNPSPGITTADTVVIAQGTFNSTALIAAGRLASKGKVQEQKYNNATIYVFNVNDQVSVPGMGSMRVRELAVTAPDANTLVMGELPAVRATLDANRARAGGVNADLVNLATRTPSALIGFGANVPPSLTKGVDFNSDEITKLIGSIRQAYGAIGTTANGFDMLMVARTERAQQAQDLSETLTQLKQFGGVLAGQLPEETAKPAQRALNSLQIGAQGNETSLKFELEMADIATLMRVLKPKVAEAR